MIWLRNLYATTIAPLKVVLAAICLCSLNAGQVYSASPERQASQRDSDWLPTLQIRTLLSGNTLTALNDSSTARWWAFFLEDGALSWVNDRGVTQFGIWYVAQDRLCQVWLATGQECWSIRSTGKVVRFDDGVTGESVKAAVLQAGDTKRLGDSIAAETYEALEELQASDPALAEGGDSSVLPGENESSNGGTTPKPIKIRIVHPDAEGTDQLISALEGVQLAAANEHADMIWDVIRGEIATNQAVIAYPRTSEPSEVQLVIDASHLFGQIQELGSERAGGLSLRIRPEEDSYKSGESIELVLVGHAFPYAILFNIGPYGEVDVVYPVDADFIGEDAEWPRLAPSSPFFVSAVAGPPYGANLVVGLVGSSEPRTLLRTLEFGGGPAGIAAFLKALRETEGQVAVASFGIRR